MVPEIRIQACNKSRVNAEGEFVLYWMTAYRRTTWNFSLTRAVSWAAELNKPLVVLEALRCGYRWASDRFHAFIIDGMADNARRFRKKDVMYYPFIEKRSRDGKGLISALARHACVVVTDDFPCFFHPAMLAAAAKKIRVRLEKIDSNGLLPMRAADKVFDRAFDFRRFLQHNLPFYLGEFVTHDPLEGQVLPKLTNLPDDIASRWPLVPLSILEESPQEIYQNLRIDHKVKPTKAIGGTFAAERTLRGFLQRKLQHYADARNQPEKAATSSLSPYLHFGHISAHQIFSEITNNTNWTLNSLSPVRNGSKNGWWGMDKSLEGFLDQLVTWRELSFNLCWQRDNYDRYESLPQWARKTLDQHAGDPRPHIYSLEQLEAAKTHDPIWNAAQKQLISEGTIHGYLRMLWGKKILEWTHHPRTALEIMIELNNKYALDGRDPNSYSGICWTLGRYDRAWGPERPIFGKIRYMSSENTARKYRLQNYLQRYTDQMSLLE